METKADAGKLKRLMAEHCRNCIVCSHARCKQEGLAFAFVKNIEAKICPFCLAYEEVYGKKAWEAEGGKEY